MIDAKRVFDALVAKAPASAPEIARHLMGGAAKTNKSDIAKTRETLKWLVADGLVTLSEIDSKRGQLFVIATTKADIPVSNNENSENSDNDDALDDIEEIAEEAIQKGFKSYIDGVIMSHAVHLTGQILAADPKTDKIWAADRALDAVRHIARRIEKEGAK